MILKYLNFPHTTIIPCQDFLHGHILFHLDNLDPVEKETKTNPIQIQKIQISGKIGLQNRILYTTGPEVRSKQLPRCLLGVATLY